MSSEARPDPHRKPAIACGLLLATAIVLVIVGRQPHPPRTIDPAKAASLKELRFTDLPDGTIAALDARSGAEIERIAPGSGGFIRVTMRSFAGERKRHGFDASKPFTLARMKDGALVLADPQTGRSMLLNAFGPSNEGVFAQLLDEGRT